MELAQKNAELVLSQDKEKIKREEGKNHRSDERDRRMAGSSGLTACGSV